MGVGNVFRLLYWEKMTAASWAVVFDYDHSLINTNSDIHIFSELCSELEDYLRAASTRGSWIEAVNETLRELHTKKPEVFPDKVHEILANVPIQEKMLEAVNY